jgi:alkanesulfonate monooxygenase SsuD/methylene tetrahydromethanopterin reductase-like flavin-dependent oxidoreductase (luciferase family)
VAAHADIWNVFGMPDTVAHKDEVLRAHCADLGRDPAAIQRSVGCKVVIRSTEAAARARYEELVRHNRIPPERLADDVTWWVGTPRQVADRMCAYLALGFDTFLCESPAPYDAETMETLIEVVKPMVDSAGAEA